ncbi:MBL fold metallo-hydrolase [Neobacillus citreus]|uniref:MBL fold metallo-hydrolase n=1 Tax=Neobacillus citreus TaxID=2833578 RepID=A0A942YB94_9BACI|nr:MBL fold metallo-hydrolase [Neobacillus citreus]MCH6268101.1 MBL fold metallo-hydrolase [Neobacillus citreus]
MNRIGPIFIVEGPNSSKVPFSRSLYIDCEEKVLIDSGAEAKALLELDHEKGIDLIINTHYHPDHTLHNHLFRDATKLINKIEFETSRSVEGIAHANGVYQEWGYKGVEAWKKTLPQEWVQNLGGFSGTYEYETEYVFDDVKVVFLHTPGHTSGLACPYFPELGVVFAGDYDMTTFGPWYNGTDGNIEDFINSGKRLLSLDADTYITGHQKGIFTKAEFTEAMDKFLAVINRRDEIIEDYIQQGLSFEEITKIGIFYPKSSLTNPLLNTWERSGIRKHLRRLGYSVEEKAAEIIKLK